jgi:Zn finger protein HypA/HybF involved in hydrogenase expression
MAKATPTKITSSGICNFCQGEFDKSKMTQHLKFCKQRAAIIKSENSTETQKTRLFHIVVEGRYLPVYWMHLEMPANSTLYELDSFLRAIWLECCDHLSEFRIGKVSYSMQPEDMMWALEDPTANTDAEDDEEDIDEDEEEPGITELSPAEIQSLPPFEVALRLSEILQQEFQANLADLSPTEFQTKFTDLIATRFGGSLPPETMAQLSKLSVFIQPLLIDLVNAEQDMDVEIGKELKVGQKIFHVYDFGSSTELALKVAAEREGVASKDDDAIEIMARNNPPEIRCRECGKPATKVASGYYNVEDGALCNACANTSLKEYEDMFLPIVNSPRVGVCGYTGDADMEEPDWDDEEEYEDEEDEEGE